MSKPGQSNTSAPAPSGRGKFRSERVEVESPAGDQDTQPKFPPFATTSAAGIKRSAGDVDGIRDEGREAKRARDAQALSNGLSRRHIQSSVSVTADTMQSMPAQLSAAQTRGAFSGAQTALTPSAAPPAARRVSQLAKPSRATKSTANASATNSGLAVTAKSHTNSGQAANPPLPSLRSNGFTKTGLNPHAHPDEYKKFAPGMVINFCPHLTAQDPNANPLRDSSFLQGRNAVVSSKERPGVISNVFANGSIRVIICSTHGGDDLENIDPRVYYMVLRDRNDELRPNRTDYRALDVVMYNGRTMGRKSSICLTHEYTIQANVFVNFVGRLTDESTEDLLDAVRRRRNAALTDWSI